MAAAARASRDQRLNPIDIRGQVERVVAEGDALDDDAAVLVVATKRNQRDEAPRELLGQLLAAGLSA